MGQKELIDILFDMLKRGKFPSKDIEEFTSRLRVVLDDQDLKFANLDLVIRCEKQGRMLLADALRWAESYPAQSLNDGKLKEAYLWLSCASLSRSMPQG